MTLFVAKIIWALGVVAYFLVRYPHQRRARKTAVAKRAVTLLEQALMAVSYCGLFVVPLVYVVTGWPARADYAFSPVAAGLGTLVLIAAIWLLYRTHRDLGRLWSMSLEIRDGHKLVTTGIYETLRHPMYASFWLWALSQALLLPNWVAGLSGLVGFGILFFMRVGHEERLMLETFGDDYRAYMKRTHRVIPGVY